MTFHGLAGFQGATFLGLAAFHGATSQGLVGGQDYGGSVDRPPFMVDGGKSVGVISQRDLAGVLAGALNEPEAVQQLVEASELVGEGRLRRIEHGLWD